MNQNSGQDPDPDSDPAPEGRRARKKSRTRDALFEAAVRLAQQRGFERVTVEQICREADTARGTFFLHFPTKHALLAEAGRRLARSLSADGSAPGVPAAARYRALLDALAIRRRKGRLQGLIVALCGDVAHSRVARSNIHLLQTLGARVRVIAPPTLLPPAIERLGVEVFYDMRAGLKDCDIVMMLRLQRERMQGTFVPSIREYFRFFGLDRDKLTQAKPDALIMHPGPMNRGVEIDSEVADDIDRSVIREQVEMGVAVRMACLETLCRDWHEPGAGAAP